MTYQEAILKYEPVIGLETHVQLATNSKLFCSCDNDSREAPPNTHICPLCLGLPGTLPVLNEAAVNLAIRTGLALNADIASLTKFDRKNYFYPDLPKGYQITQFDQPIVGKGSIKVEVDGNPITVGITRAHLEEDAGKLVHPANKDYSLVDLNRAGTPLLEIVSEPDMHSPAEARAYAQTLYLTVRYAGTSNANLYYGNMRFDVNVSLRKIGEKTLGTRSETKNLNSFRSVERAVEFEVTRQAELLDRGEKVVQETRGFNDDDGTTFSQRSKEEADEYRYFPEPDLPPLHITSEMISRASKQLQTPAKVRSELFEAGVTAQIVDVLIGTPELARLQLEASRGQNDKVVRRIGNWLVTEIQAKLSAGEMDLGSTKLTADGLSQLANLTEAGQLSSTAAKQVLDRLISDGGHPKEVAEKLGLIQQSDSSQLEKVADQVIADNPQAVADYKAGNARAVGALVGAAMKATKGQGNPQVLTRIISDRLNSK